MRRSLALLATAVVSAPLLLVGPSASAAGVVNVTEVRSVVDNGRRDHPLTITVRARSATDITKVTALLRDYDGKLYATLDGFARSSGSARDGVWTITLPFDIAAHPGLTAVEVNATSVGGSGSSGDVFYACYQTTVEDFDFAPKAIDIATPEIAMRGRVMYREHTEDTLKPAAGAAVYTHELKESSADDQGRFDVKAPRHVSPYVVAGRGNFSPYCEVKRDAAVEIVKYDAELTARIDPSAPDTVTVGDTVKITGRLRWTGPKGTFAYGGQRVTAVSQAPGYINGQQIGSAYTQPDGTFTIDAKPSNTAKVVVRVEESPFFNKGEAPAGELTVLYGTKFANLAATPTGPGQAKLTGTLFTTIGGYTSGGRLVLERSADGVTWTKLKDWYTRSAGFEIPAEVPADAFWRVRYLGDARYRPATSDKVAVRAHVPTTLAAPSATPSTVTEGGTVTVWSRLSRQGTGPLGNAPLTVEFSTDGTSWKAVAQGRTGVNGEAAIKVKATANGRWRVRYAGDPTAKPSLSASVAVKVRQWTRFQKVNAGPEPVRKGKTLTVLGELQRHDASWRAAGTGTQVAVYFKAKGSSKWTRMAVVKTDRKGAFKKGFKASKDGYWKVAFPGSSSYAPSESAGDYVDVR